MCSPFCKSCVLLFCSFRVFHIAYRCLNAIFKVSKSFHFFFLDTYRLSKSSEWCKTLCRVIDFFFVLWFICLCSILVHLQNGPEYLTKGTAQLFIHFYKVPAIQFCFEYLFRSYVVPVLKFSSHLYLFDYYYYYYYYHYYYYYWCCCCCCCCCCYGCCCYRCYCFLVTFSHQL